MREGERGREERGRGFDQVTKVLHLHGGELF
jgi:hypothetical protein